MVEPKTSTESSHPRRPYRNPIRFGAALLAGLSATAFITASPTRAQTSEPLPDVEPSAEPTTESSDIPTDVRFQCQLLDGEYTVMYLPENQPESAYPWATPRAMGGGWTAENRCFTISERLEAYRPEGLAELRTGTENGYDTVCATTEQFPSLCKIVFTVPPGQNPTITRDRVFENLALADGGNNTTIVNTYAASDDGGLLSQLGDVINNFPLPGGSSPVASPVDFGSDSINLKPFLAPADGGTGTALKAPVSSSRSLNPENFR